MPHRSSSALRLCQLANNIKGRPHRKHILSRDRAYHGSTFLAASVTGKERDKTAMDTLKDTVHFLTAPSLFHYHGELSEAAFCDFLQVKRSLAFRGNTAEIGMSTCFDTACDS